MSPRRFYDFVQLTEWLEYKALEGLKLKYIKNGLTFIFERTIPCRIKYFVDTQKKVTQGYLEVTKNQKERLWKTYREYSNCNHQLTNCYSYLIVKKNSFIYN